mgnify:CR=1 FL=1
MKEQTIKIKINGEDREVLAGNAALLRFRKAGGDMSLISSIDGEDTDALFGPPVSLFTAVASLLTLVR